jgi:hypothetical protein
MCFAYVMEKNTHIIRMVILWKNKAPPFLANGNISSLSDHTPKPPENNDDDDSNNFCSLKVLDEALCIIFMLWLVDGDKL